MQVASGTADRRRSQERRQTSGRDLPQTTHGGSSMLVLSRKRGQTLVIGDDIRVVVQRINGNRVTLGIEAPAHVHILRGELDDCLEKAEQEQPAATANA